MSDPLDQEIEAIRKVLTALQPLSDKARASVLDYAIRRLGIDAPALLPGLEDGDTSIAQPPAEAPPGAPPHIKDLKNQKKPRSANEMAALVAYYLANLAPPSERKNQITQKDIETYFKIAEFPLPKQPRGTLPNAKTAGYFDLGADGYKLNPVGHNLVVHSMPRGGKSTQRRSKKTKKAKTKRKSGKKAKAKRKSNRSK